MIFEFDPTDILIRVPATITFGGGAYDLACAIDTGATKTVVDQTVLQAMGVSTDGEPSEEIVTASGISRAIAVKVASFEALARIRSDFQVPAFDLPQALGIDALIGLNFFRTTDLTIDSINGYIEVRES